MSRLETAELLLKVIRELAVIALGACVLIILAPALPRLIGEAQQAHLTEINAGVLKLTVAAVKDAKTELRSVVQEQAPNAGAGDAPVPPGTKRIVEAIQRLDEAQSALQATAASTPPSPEPSESPIPTALNTRAAASAWVYLGERRRGSTDWLSPPEFDVTSVPKANEIIHARVDAFKRERAPQYQNGQWTKGNTTGIVSQGQPVRVLETRAIPGTEQRELWWARVVEQ